MNMISTAFPIEQDASKKQGDLVKKLTSVWEKKNSKTARAGGLSLMALSLAACGAEDDTPFSQADVTAAATAATTAAEAAAAEAAILAEAAAIFAQAEAIEAAEIVSAAAATFVAEAAAADAAAAAAIIAEASKAEAVAAAEAAAVITQAAAVAAAESAAAATAAALKTSTDAALAAVQASYDALVAPKSLTLALTTAEILNGGPGADVFTAPSAFYADADQVIDATAGDGDIYNLNLIASSTPVVTNIETINVTVNSLAAVTLTASSMAGVDNLNVTMGDVTVGGSVIAGTSIVTIAALDAADVAKVTTGTGVTAVSITQATTSGLVVDTDTATGNTTIVGAATVTAMGAGTGDTVTVQALNNAVQDAKPVDITTSAASVATTVNTLNFTGTINIDAVNATTVDVASGLGGMTIVAAGNAGTSGTNGIDVHGVDASGATITTTYVGSTTGGAEGEIQITGTAAVTDVATISANGATNIDNDGTAVDILNLSGNTTDATYYIVDIAAATYAGSGSHSVNLSGNVAKFSGTTVSGVNSLTFSAGTAADIDLDSVDATSTVLGYNNLGDKGGTEMIFTVKSGASMLVNTNQTDFILDWGATETANNFSITAGDVNGALNSAVGTLGLVDVDLAGGALAGTITLEASAANVLANSTELGAKHNLVITGDENVTLGTLTGLSVDASASTGIINLTATTMKTVTTGNGADALVVNGNVVHTVITNGGNDTIDLNDTADASSFSTGDGNDTITIDAAGGNESIVITLGDGTDKVTTDQALDAIIIGGTGTDTMDFDGNNVDYGAKANFTFSGFEVIDISGITTDITFSAAQLANNATAAVTSSADTLSVTVLAAGQALDASGLTLSSGSTGTFHYTGLANNADTITGGVQNESAFFTSGADVIDMGTGTDTFVMADTTLNGAALGVASSGTSIGAVFNISGSTVTAATVVSDIVGTNWTGNNVDIGAGSVGHTYATNAAANATVVTTLAGVENITAGDGADYIVGSGSANALRGAAGADTIRAGDANDYIQGGAGSDTVYGGNGVDEFASHSALAANVTIIKDWEATDKFVFGADANSATALDLFDSGSSILVNTDATALTIDAAGNAGTVVVAATDYVEIDNSGTLVIEKVNVITTAAGFANVGEALDGPTSAADGTNSDMILIFYNSASTNVEMYDVTNNGTAAANHTNNVSTLVASFDNIAASGIAAAFANTAFEVELIA
jgi:Ca2+-binding RTX toxin-like protein